jgi:PTH2 family peptidyl-tRNA hydrolase
MQMTMSELKQVILVRQDLKLPKGKLAAQVGHACIDAAFASPKQLVKKWRDSGMKKIVLKVNDEKELLEYERKCQEADLVTSLIIDAGHTTVKPGTMTCLGIGPAASEKIDKITGNLKMM